MLLNKFISIFYKPSSPQEEIDYCLQFSGNGYIKINDLRQFLDYRADFYFEMQFKIKTFPHSGFNYLMNSCFHKTDNKIGIAIDGTYIYVQIDKGISGKIERYITFSDDINWHTIKVTNNRGSLSAMLDESILFNNMVPSLSLPLVLGFNIASDTNLAKGLTGNVDNILLSDLRHSIAQYPLNTGSGAIAYDSINHYNGTITNGSWNSRI